MSALPVTELAEAGALPVYVYKLVLGCLQALHSTTRGKRVHCQGMCIHLCSGACRRYSTTRANRVRCQVMCIHLYWGACRSYRTTRANRVRCQGICIHLCWGACRSYSTTRANRVHCQGMRIHLYWGACRRYSTTHATRGRQCSSCGYGDSSRVRPCCSMSSSPFFSTKSG